MSDFMRTVLLGTGCAFAFFSALWWLGWLWIMGWDVRGALRRLACWRKK